MAVETLGKVIIWEEGGEVSAKHCSSLAGNSIVKVGVGGHGCLGHGDTQDLELPTFLQTIR